VPISYDLDLNLPTDPGLPPGEAYDEFRRIYAALRNLQDGISLASGLITYDQESLAGLNPLSTYLLGNQCILIFEAQTNIAIGEMVEGVTVGSVLKVKQPIDVTFDDSGFPDWDRYIGMPLFACSAGQHVAVATKYGVAPKPGAVCGYAYHLNTSLVLTQTTDVTAPYFFVGEAEAAAYTAGFCVEDNKLILTNSGGYYT